MCGPRGWFQNHLFEIKFKSVENEKRCFGEWCDDNGNREFKSIKPKQYIELFQDILLNHTIKIFLKHSEINLILLVLNKKHKKFFNQIIRDKKILYTYGGDSRQKSVLYGLKYIKRFRPLNVLIHDASRPFADTKLITEILKIITH